MSWWHDAVDWLGGDLFEVAKPEGIIHFCRRRGFIVDRIKSAGSRLSYNEFVFSNHAEYLCNSSIQPNR